MPIYGKKLQKTGSDLFPNASAWVKTYTALSAHVQISLRKIVFFASKHLLCKTQNLAEKKKIILPSNISLRFRGETLKNSAKFIDLNFDKSSYCI